MTDENYEASAQAHLASLKRDMKASMEDAVVRAVHKVMAEFEAKSDHQLMENAQGDLELIKLVQTGVGIGKQEQELCGGCGGSGRVPRDPDIGTDQECFVCDGTGAQPKEPEQEPVAWLDNDGERVVTSKQKAGMPQRLQSSFPIPLGYTTPPQRKPLTVIQSIKEEAETGLVIGDEIGMRDALEQILREANEHLGIKE